MGMKYIKTEVALGLEALANEDGRVLDFAPTRATDGSNGFDLKACITEDIVLQPGESYLVPTGVHIWLDTASVKEEDDVNEPDIMLGGLYLPRSSVKGLVLENTVGLLDNDYQGESFFKYFNRSSIPLTIKSGQKIGQLVIVFTYIGEFEQVNSFDVDTTRGQGGFGSTGV